jgi:2-polyprenyl-3-methyl-5-hydroxy-6-metoxy-1,4-benzoquinol methylase
MPSYGYVGDQTRHNAHRLLVELTGANKRVLDVGCASGYLAARLKHAGCRVTGIELDPSAARQAEAHCERVIVGRADETALEATGGGFDVILCGDVLEHMPDPSIPLGAFPRLLNPNGSLVVSLPNIAYAPIRFRLLLGRFDYREGGIMDRSHLRFYTLTSARRLFRECGWREVEFRPTAYHFPSLLASRWPALFAPQFVFRLVR